MPGSNTRGGTRVWPLDTGTDPRLSDADVAHIKFTGPYGWADYSDDEIGQALSLPADVPVQVNRPLSPSAANNRLTGPFEGYNFWKGTPEDMRVVPRAVGDVLMIEVFAAITPEVEQGSIRCDLFVGGAIGSIGAKGYAFTVQAGDVEEFRFPTFIVPVRNSFFTNGAQIVLTSTVPASLTEISPEFYPVSVPELIDG